MEHTYIKTSKNDITDSFEKLLKLLEKQKNQEIVGRCGESRLTTKGSGNCDKTCVHYLQPKILFETNRRGEVTAAEFNPHYCKRHKRNIGSQDIIKIKKSFLNIVQ